MADAGSMEGEYDAFFIGDADDRDTDESSRDSGGSGDEDGRESALSGWNDRTPSGWRARVDVVEAAEKTRRPPHTQRSSSALLYPRGFDGTQFVGYLKSEIKMARNGDVILNITVPYEYKHLAFPLSDAFGVPLSFDVQLWEPYAHAIENMGNNE